MDMQSLVGKTVMTVEEKYFGAILEITFTDDTVLRVKQFGYGDGISYEINPEEL